MLQLSTKDNPNQESQTLNTISATLLCIYETIYLIMHNLLIIGVLQSKKHK